MYGSRTESVVLWRNFFDSFETYKMMMYNYRVWLQSRHLSIWGVTLCELNIKNY